MLLCNDNTTCNSKLLEQMDGWNNDQPALMANASMVKGLFQVQIHDCLVAVFAGA
jgi:hypothetical protein